jgi:hypothetical protein
MNLELTPAEAEYLVELLDTAHRTRLHELHHTSTRAYADILRGQVELIESLRTRIESHRATPVG